MNATRLFFVILLSVSFIGCVSDDAAPAKTADSGITDSGVEESGKRPVTAEKLNLNTASAEEFLTIPGVGDRMVHEFEEYRPYISIVQFRTEMAKYVDEELITGYEEHVYVPIDFNESDAETVAQILGLDVAGAERLVAMRPFEDRQAFLSAVTDVADGVTSQFARLYLAED